LTINYLYDPVFKAKNSTKNQENTGL